VRPCPASVRWLLALALLASGLSLSTHAQDLNALGGSNMAGLYGLDVNPASIADSKLRMDFLLFGAGFNVQGDYAALRRGKLFDAFERADFARPLTDPDKAWNERLVGGGTRSQHLNLRANLAPLGGFMLTLSPKTAIAFTANLRVVASIVDANPESIRLFLSDFRASDLYGQPVTNERGAMLAQHWLEYGFSYARVLQDEGRHFFKAGARLKLLQGANGFSFAADGVNYTQVSIDQTSIAPGSQFNYAFSRNFGFPTPFLENSGRILQFTSAPGIGADLGVIYEFRPRIVDYTYDMDGERNLPVRDQMKYRLRVGLSLLDLGGITYKTDAVARQVRVPGGAGNLVYPDLAAASAAEVDARVVSTYGPGTLGTHRLSLPTRLSLQLDGRITDRWYVGAVMMQSLADRRTSPTLPSTYQITPRYESKVLDVLVPVTFNEYGHTAIGTFVRVGPLYVGSNSLWNSFVVGEESFVTDVFIGVKIPVRYTRPKDRDGDKVSDERDQCPKEKGTWEFNGCPDTDGDHVADKDDQCPQDPGLPRFGGCPDTDGDGVPDKDDTCPRTPGLPSNKGCPEGFIELKKDG